jgi:Cellulose binding domain/Glycosyl hydrolase family 12
MSGRVTRAPRGYTRIGALRPAVALAAVVLATAGAAALSLAQPAASVAGCRVSYTITSSWQGGFTANVSVENLGSPIKNWTLAFSLPGDETVTQRWNADYSQSERNVTASNSTYNVSLRTNQSTQIGFNGAYTKGSFPGNPSSFTLDATPCTAVVSSSRPAPVSAAPDVPPPPPTPTRDAAGHLYDSSFRYAQYEIGGYAISNDEWGTGYNTQTVWVNSATDWGMTATQPDTPNVKSYANIGKNMNVPLNSLPSATSSFNETNPDHGNWESAYDVWLNGTGIEVMAWTYVNGSAQPLGYPAHTVTLDGNTWTLYVGNNGHNPTYSFVRQGNETSGTVDLLGLLKYLENTGGYFSNPTLSSIQYGWEITGTGNVPTNFTMNDYSASTS